MTDPLTVVGWFAVALILLLGAGWVLRKLYENASLRLDLSMAQYERDQAELLKRQAQAIAFREGYHAGLESDGLSSRLRTGQGSG